MKTTEELKKEHQGIKLMLRILRVIAAKVEEGERLPQGDLEAIAEFLSVFADKCHHGKEEEYLFPALEAAGVSREGGPIGVMLSEHTKGRALIAGLKEAIPGLGSGERNAPGRFASVAREYAGLLTQHIEKEDGVLFPMTEARITADQDEELFEAFENLERERIGSGKHEEFHRLLKRLKKAYLE
jgi:hemerythrin-like domain-containing protein